MSTYEKDVEYQTVAIVDPFGRLKVKVISDDLAQNTVKFCNYLYDTSYDMKPSGKSSYFNWEKGFGDVSSEVDLKSKRLVNGSEMFFCLPYNEQGQLLEICPRNMLMLAIEKLGQYDLQLKVGVELEFYVFKNKPLAKDFSTVEVNDYDGDYDFQQSTLIAQDWHELEKKLVAAGVEVEGYKSECGRGQVEVNLRYSQALSQADSVIIAKHIIKSFYAQKGLLCTFMAKPNMDDAGSGLHTHISLHSSSTGANVNPQIFECAINGVVTRARDWMPFYAPNTNSYKRFSKHSWAPTEVTAGSDDRTSMVRIIGNVSKRFEFRLPGADANIYLVLVGLIYSICDGLEMSVHDAEARLIDKHLFAAINVFNESTPVEKYIGAAAKSHYVNLFTSEFELANNVVSIDELERYLKHA